MPRKIRYYHSLFLLVISAFLAACNDSDRIGLNLQPANEQPTIGKIDTLSVVSYTVPEDSLIVWSTLKNLLEQPTLFIGSNDDPYVGKTYAGFVSQVKLGNTISSTTFNGIQTPDSIVLSFSYKGLTGDSTSKHHLSVYELGEALNKDSVYYSTRTYAKGNLIGHLDFVPDLNDSVTIGTTVSAPQLRIALDTAFGGKILRQYITNPGTFDNSDNFLTFLNGLVVVDSVEGNGSIVSLNSVSTLNRMTLYYDSTYSYQFVSDVNCVRMSYFSHDYKAFNTDLQSDDQLVVQSTAGLKDSLYIPNLSSIYNKGKVAISSAKLTFKLLSGSNTTGYNPHANLLVFASDANGKNVSIIDASEASGYYGGTFDATNNQYTFNIARHLQRTVKSIVENGGKDYGLFLVAGGSTSNAQRTVLSGNSSIKLIITYTKIN